MDSKKKSKSETSEAPVTADKISEPESTGTLAGIYYEG
jgi:hypothetical protein